MHVNNLPTELSIDLLTHDLDSRSFLMFLRRENERYREISTSEHDRQYSLNYTSFDHARGFSRMNKYVNLSSNSLIPSHILSENGRIITNDISKQLLDDNLSIVRRQWKKSKKNLSNQIEHIQSDLNSHTNMSSSLYLNDYNDALNTYENIENYPLTSDLSPYMQQNRIRRTSIVKRSQRNANILYRYCRRNGQAPSFCLKYAVRMIFATGH
ncbi:unnamed protein product [Adineta steineri]|uniref:Uncharacterized protein n=1 Tax=Adineta steineri TaxID=433720 RepID=A0A814V2Z6_9BILA|nr:unnamed protein product [Adineta steineri]CAF3904106.1 unnamed protein product [Adineta steineri]